MCSVDLIAVVVQLRAVVPTYIDNHMGRAVQAYGLSILGSYAPELARTIHDTDDHKPFTVSGLMQGERLLYGKVIPEDEAWIRFTGLSEEVSHALKAFCGSTTDQLRSGESLYIQLDYLPWLITGVHYTDHPWAGTDSYQGLIDQYRHSPAPRRVDLEFVSPTTFRSNGLNQPLPLASLVFGSLLTRWTTFTSHLLRELPYEQLDAYIGNHVLLTQYSTRTGLVRGKAGSKEVGFTGLARFEFLHASEHLEKHAPELETLLRTQSKWFARTMGLLSKFAFYSGIGRRTTTGLGSVRLRE